MKLFSLSLLLAGILLSACNSETTTQAATDLDTPSANHLDTARELAQRYVMADGHVDLPYRMRIHNFRVSKEYLDVSERTPEGDFDYVRSKAGGLDAPFMSIYIPSQYQATPGRSKQVADTLIAMVQGIPERYPDKFALANSPDEIEANFKKGLISLPMGMENGSPIETDIDNVAYFHKAGIRYITLTHATDNKICDSSYDTTRTWNGLSPFGVEVVQEMNRVGIMVDISHVSDSAFYDVMKIVETPVIASHSSCRFYTPGFERNMNDDMIKMLGENGGVMMINFGSTFIDSVSRARSNMLSDAWNVYKAESGATYGDSLYEEFRKDFFEQNGSLFSNVKVVADHIEHVAKIAGVDHVGFGSDFDGVGDSLPVGLKDVSDYPTLIAELLDRGFTEADIEKMCFGNLARVWRAVEAHASGV
ncbi:MAG: dipeptidase [Bacteroidota bacterium]